MRVLRTVGREADSGRGVRGVRAEPAGAVCGRDVWEGRAGGYAGGACWRAANGW